MLWLMNLHLYSPLEIKQNSETFQWYLKMPTVFKENRDIIAEKTTEYQELLKRRIEQFTRDLDTYWEQVQDYENWGDFEQIAKYKKKAGVLDNRLVQAMEKIDRVNEEEASYGWELSQYPLRKQTHDKLKPYKTLFDAGQEFIDKRTTWLNSQVGSFEPEEIETEMGNIFRVVLKLEKTLGERPVTKKLADDVCGLFFLFFATIIFFYFIVQVKEVISTFKENMPTIQTLGNPGMKERHWEQISEIVGFPIKISPELTLDRIIEFGLEEYLPKFESISESATKENNLERGMNKMFAEWKDMEFVAKPYRDTGTYSLSSIDDIQTLLDDHIIKTQTMKGSPYIKPFEKQIL